MLCLTGGPNLHNVVQYFFDVWVVKYRFHLAGQLTRSQNLGIAQGAGGPSINFTATVAMVVGGTQLVEKAHLTGGSTRFVANKTIVAITQFFGGEIIKCALLIILRF